MAKRAADDSFVAFVLEQLAALPALEARAMFGGHGLYTEGRFFGILHRGRLYFKTDERSRAEYRTRGMDCFRPNPKQSLKNYYEVPVDILESEALVIWARRAVALSRAAADPAAALGYTARP